MQELDLGRAEIHPHTPLVAGSYTTLTYTYTAGHPIDDTGYLKIVFRFAGDFGRPQFADPSAPNYCRVRTTGDCRLVPRWDGKGHTRPWGHALYIQVTSGYLNRGERIIVVFGDRAGGSPGWRVQSFCERTFEFKTLVDPIATYEFKELPASPVIEIIPGAPAKAVCVAPSQVRVGEPFIYHLKLEDMWGNPTARPQRMAHPGFATPGVEAIEAQDAEMGLAARSNPVDILAVPTDRHPYWGDMHGQSEETIGSNSIEDYFTFARDYGLLDIAAHQGNDFQITDAFWAVINETTRGYYKPGSFVTFPGFEWSGNTPLGGDRNVYYASEGGEITHSCYDLLPGVTSAYTQSPTAAEMFRNLRGPGPFVFAHVGGRYADLSMHDPDAEIAVEVHSAWGTFEWLVEDALARGYRIGICANSDGHKGRPGASYPGARKFGSYGGLTCVLAERLDRESVHAALVARHFYATTGNRPLLDVTLMAADGRQAMMGDVIDAGHGTPTLKVRVIGTAPLDRVEVRNGLEIIRTLRPFGAAELGRRIAVLWSGAEVRGRARAATWDGSLTVQGNRILSYVPINFWNPLQPLRQVSPHRLEWQSITTGGLAGTILELEEMDVGTLEIATAQIRVECEMAAIGLAPRAWECGGLRKRIEVHRLPDRQSSAEFAFELSLEHLTRGDNPIYVRVSQEDGHMAWSSPIYLIVAPA